MFTKRELNQLEKYLKGDIIQERDRFLIEKLQSMGLATSGFHDNGKEAHETSRLTPLGYDLFKSSKIKYNPIKKLFSGLMASTY